MNNLICFILGAFVGGNIVTIALSALVMSEQNESKKNTEISQKT